MDGKPIVGSYRSHQVPISDPKANPARLKLLEDWLRSYHVEEVFDAQGSPRADIRLAGTRNARVAIRASERVHHYEYVLRDFRRSIQEHGVNPAEIATWQWS